LDKRIIDYHIESDESPFVGVSPNFPDETDEDGYGPDGILRGIEACVKVRMKYGFQPFGSLQVTSHTLENGREVFTYHQAMVKYGD